MRLPAALLFVTAFIFPACGFADTAAAQPSTSVERGRYLAVLGDCAGCHTRAHGPAYAGGLPFHARFGTVYSTNITPDVKTGIGGWTEAEFYRALHDGIAADGSHLYPAFPYVYFRRLTRKDTDDLLAYLRTLKPVHREPTPDTLVFPFNIRALMIFWNWLYLPHGGHKTDTAGSAAWQRGEFLVNGIGHCAACHTPKSVLFGDIAGKELTGAVVDHWFSANLTGSTAGGLGKWSRSDLVTYLATGRNRYATAAGSMQEKVSSSTSHMRPQDRAAIAVYLKSLAPRNLVRHGKPDPTRMKAGQVVFVEHCAVCHQEPQVVSSVGPLPDYPRLGGDTLVVGHDPSTVLRIILEGALAPTTPNAPTGFSMPSFATLTDRQIADVATYIRANWGNKAAPVERRTVHELRAALGGGS
jgi:mono/diheme cytochrome c family protein